MSGDPHTDRGYASRSDEELHVLLRSERAVAEPAFAELYARHSTRVYAYCRCVFGNSPELQDVFQDTFVKFYEHARSDQEVRNVPAFLLRIARNLCLNAKRNAKQLVSIDDVPLAAHDPSLERKEMLQLITMAMDLLADEYREAFFLREFEDLPYAEIAEMLGATPVTVRIRVSRARTQIREILHPYLAEYSRS